MHGIFIPLGYVMVVRMCSSVSKRFLFTNIENGNYLAWKSLVRSAGVLFYGICILCFVSPIHFDSTPKVSVRDLIRTILLLGPLIFVHILHQISYLTLFIRTRKKRPSGSRLAKYLFPLSFTWDNLIFGFGEVFASPTAEEICFRHASRTSCPLTRNSVILSALFFSIAHAHRQIIPSLIRPTYVLVSRLILPMIRMIIKNKFKLGKFHPKNDENLKSTENKSLLSKSESPRKMDSGGGEQAETEKDAWIWIDCLPVFIQCGFTFIFGLYVGFIHQRLASQDEFGEGGALLSVIIIHAICNLVTFPNIFNLTHTQIALFIIASLTVSIIVFIY